MRTGRGRTIHSPLWDAHVSMWTPAAVAEGEVKRISSLGELARMVRGGEMMDAAINPPGQANGYVAGLRSTRAIINCPVTAQPDLPPQ